MPDVLLCGGCGKGLRPGQVGTWREFIALEAVGGRSHKIRDKRYTGRVLCAECALPPPTGSFFEPDFDPDPLIGATRELPVSLSTTGRKPLVGASR